MKKVLLFIAGSLGLFCVISNGELKVAEKPNVPYALKLDQEINITDTRGVLIPSAILGLNPSETVKITLTDGTVILGVVKTTEVFNKKVYKVFGDVVNGDNAGFGFGMSEDGIFGGAVVYRNTDVIYKIQYIESLKGYIFIKSKAEPKVS